MKHLKTFEKSNINVGDIVVCIDGIDDGNNEVPLTGKKYKLLKIYTERISKDEDFVEVQDIITGKILNGWLINRFITEYEHDSKKYNL